MALGIEHLRLNGVYMDDETAMHTKFGNGTLVNLAGNSFDGTTFTAVLVTLMTFLGVIAEAGAVMPEVTPLTTGEDHRYLCTVGALFDDDSDSSSSSS